MVDNLKNLKSDERWLQKGDVRLSPVNFVGKATDWTRSKSKSCHLLRLIFYHFRLFSCLDWPEALHILFCQPQLIGPRATETDQSIPVVQHNWQLHQDVQSRHSQGAVICAYEPCRSHDHFNMIVTTTLFFFKTKITWASRPCREFWLPELLFSSYSHRHSRACHE